MYNAGLRCVLFILAAGCGLELEQNHDVEATESELSLATPVSATFWRGRSALTWRQLPESDRKTIQRVMVFAAASGGSTAADTCGADESGWSCIVDGVLHWCDHTASGPDCGSAPIE